MLEMVEVEQRQRRPSPFGAGRGQAARQNALRRAAIIEAGQVIVLGLVTQASLQLYVLFEPPLQLVALGDQLLADLAAVGHVAQNQQAAAVSPPASERRNTS